MLKEVNVERLGGPPSNSVMFDFESVNFTRESSTRKLHGISVIGQSVHSTSQYDGTDHVNFELESIARKKADEPVGAIVCVGSAE